MKSRMAFRFIIIGFAALLAFILSCSTPTPEQKKYRAELGKRGIPFEIDSMFEFIVKEDIDVVRLFIKAGIDLNDVTFKTPYGVKVDITRGRTPLMTACYMGNMELVKLFIEHGANINALSRNGNRRSCKDTPLMYAVLMGRKDVVLFLLEKKADVNLKSECGVITALHAASANGMIDLVKILLDAGADVNAQITDPNKHMRWESALIYAVDYKHAPYNSVSYYNGYPYRARSDDVAVREQIEIARILLAKGAEVNIKREKDGRTPLMMACNNEHPEMVRLLLEKGADRNIRDNDGKTALMLAEYYNLRGSRDSRGIVNMLKKQESK